MEVYERLLADQGPRHWWPAESKFEVIVGAILTQNTAWRNVRPAIRNMQQAGIWSCKAVHDAHGPDLINAIRPAGYYNSKARKLKEFAGLVVREFHGDLDALLSLETGTLRDTLLGVWGIGEETADDIVLYAAGKPSFVIDKYTIRIAGRLGWLAGGNKYTHYQRLFTRRLPAEAPLYNEYHALLDGHASRTCRKVPLCAGCCLADICRTGRSRIARENA
jgi:endonuclease-3 related protein